MASIPRKDIPAFVRRCYQAWKIATREIREQEEERLRFYDNDQWRQDEVTKRTAQGRPFLTVNKCRPAVDQIEGDIRQNPPGPKVLPVGEGADSDIADINAGIIREIEHRSNAKTAYSTAAKYQAACGCGYLELATSWVSDRSFDQQLDILSVEDPATVFYDPDSRMANREDAMWCGKLKQYSKEKYEETFGKKHQVLQGKAAWSPATIGGWIQDAIGYEGSLSQLNEWTGAGKGPFYVAEFFLVELDSVKLRMYSDGVARFDDEPVPRGVKEKPNVDPREVNKRTIIKYVVDAFEILDDTETIFTILPLIPVLGPEVYIKGKLHRASIISGALDSQRALNYVATTACELAGLMPKAPWIGYKGQFDDPRWQTANSEMWAYLEVEPVHSIDPTTGASELLPAPQRNTWETPIQWLLALGAWFTDSIQAVTAIYNPSLGAQKGDQSGVAINQLRSESSVGNFSYADNLHRAIAVVYNEIVRVSPKILSGPRVITIVRPDSQHEMLTIGQEFQDGIDPANGNKVDGPRTLSGRYAVVVTVGPNFEDRAAETAEILTEFLKIDPQILAVPGVAAKALRSISQGDPEIEGIADLLEPQNQNAQQLAGQLQKATQQNQMLTVALQQIKQKLDAKMPQVEADKWKTLVDNVTKIRVAEIANSADADKQQADLLADHMEQLTGMAHDVAMAEVQHGQAKELAQQSADNASVQQAQAAEQQQSAQPTGAGQ